MYSVKFRKLLLWDRFYQILFLIACLFCILNITFPKKSVYKESTTKEVCIITKIIEKEEYTTYELKGKEKLIGTIKEKNKYSLGDKVTIIGEWRKPTQNTTKNLFNYQEYLKNKKIYYTVSIKKIILQKKNKNLFYTIKQIIVSSFHKNPYLHTFLLGDKSYLKDEVKRSFQQNGISHLFAISGMHITLLSSILKKILKKFQREENVYKTITIILFLYLLFVGFSPSMVRGVLFFFLFEGNKIYYFYIKKENLFLLTLSISLFLNPYNVFDIGFQYSYLISYALLKESDSLSSNNKILSLLKVSLLSFLVSIPISLKNFNQLNILSILYNLFYVPYVSTIVFPMTLISAILKPIEPIYNILTIILEESSLFLSKIKIGIFIWKDIPNIFYYIYLILILIFLNTKRKEILYIFLSIIILHFIIPYTFSNEEVKIIDVGQGDSILLISNGESALIDTGGIASYENQDGKIFYNILSPTLKKEGIKKLKYLILSHGDKDHMGEAKILIEEMDVENIILNCGEYNYLEKEIIELSKKNHHKIYSCVEELKLGKDTLFFLNTEEKNNENDNSSVIYTKMGNYAFLFTGDAGVEREKDILEEYDLGPIDFFKVGHHGSSTSTSEEFIKIINPKVSLISVGENNKFNHPHKEILDRLQNSKILRTDKDGTITIHLKKNLKMEIFK